MSTSENCLYYVRIDLLEFSFHTEDIPIFRGASLLMQDVTKCVEAKLRNLCSAGEVARVMLDTSHVILVFAPPSEEVGMSWRRHSAMTDAISSHFGHAEFAVDVYRAGESFTIDKSWCPGQQMTLNFPDGLVD